MSASKAELAALRAVQDRIADARRSVGPFVVACPLCGYGHSAAVGCPHCHPLTLFGNHRDD